MEYVADTNTFLAVAMNEPEKAWLTEATEGCDLIAPEVLPYEIGNALSAIAKRKAVSRVQAADIWNAIVKIPVRLATIDILAAVDLAIHHGIYAYDGYFLQCALETRNPLLTLDRRMRRVARQLDIRLVERS